MSNNKIFTFKQIVLNCCGVIALVLGIAGILLPLLPTTPFLLLASACFLRGSPRLNDWLTNHGTLGVIITDWQQHRCIAKKVKQRGALFICCSFAISIVMVQPIWLKFTLAVLFLVIFTFFLRIPVKQSVDE